MSELKRTQLYDTHVAAGAELVGIGCAVEKGFQGGGDRLRTQGVRVESLAIIEEMSDDGIRFRR